MQSIKREATHADLVHLVNYHPGTGGLAFVFQPDFPASDAPQYGVTSTAALSLGALTFAHEVGHNAVSFG